MTCSTDRKRTRAVNASGDAIRGHLGGEMLNRSRMPAAHRPERADRVVVQRVPYGLDDDLSADEGEEHLAAVGHVHGLREIPRDQDSEAAADPLDARLSV